MRSLAAGVVVGLLSLAACRSRPAPPAPPPDTAPLVDLDPGEAIALWMQPNISTSSAPPTTVLLDARGDVIRRESGVLLLLPEGPARLTIDTQYVPRAPCPQGHQPFPVSIFQRATVTLPAASVTLLPLAASSAAAPAEEHHGPLASLGPYLLVRSSRVAEPCADPPRYMASLTVVVLSASAVEKIPTEQLTQGADPQRAAAAALLQRQLPHEPPPAPSALLLTLGQPDFSTEGLRWMVQYTTPTNLIDMDGSWGSGTRSVLLPTPFPPRVLPVARMPRVALRYLREHPDFTVSGVSVGRITP